MRLTGRRESSNVDDRRGQGFSLSKGKMGIGGIIVAVLISWMLGGNPMDVLQEVGTSQLTDVAEQSANGTFSAEEEELAKFSRQILAGTEDVWTKIFREMGRTYEPPHMVLYTGSVQTSCGNGQAAMGPFYCPGDQCLYIDLSFFSQMKSQLGAEGDFAYAYVIAHEVGHHVEYLLGTLDDAHAEMARLPKAEANEVSVRLELLADFYAGIWAYHDNEMFGSIEDGDMEEAIHCAHQIGDNYLQEQARGHAVPESFTHGTSQQRMRWLKLGLATGDMTKGNTFDIPYTSL